MKFLNSLSPRLRWVVLGAGALIVVGVVAVVIGLTSADDKSSSSTQVSPEQYAEIQQGWTKRQVRTLAGPPETRDVTTAGRLQTECWYYGVGDKGNTTQFCFQNGKLSIKTRY